MVGHLSEEEFASLLSGERPSPSAESHVARCPACRAQLAERRQDEALFDELAGAVRPSNLDPPRDLGDDSGSTGNRTRPAPTRALLTSDAIPGYELLGEIRRGGQGTVYLARQSSTKRDVALKVLARAHEGAPRNRRRFEREVDLLSRLRHPHVICVYESGETDGRLWYAMELADGDTLDENLQRTELGLVARLDLFEGIAEGVAHAHRNGVIHRDLKPANILVDPAGKPRIVDFGLALAATDDAGERLTETGEFLGTLAYASPEQVRGACADTRTDVHALGLLLYELLTGRLPWDTTGSVSDVLRRVERTPPEDPCTLAREVDTELRTILLTALAKEPSERYASADAMLRDVRHYRAREPLEARAHSTTYVLRKALSRHRTGLAIACGTLLLLAITATVLVRGHLKQARQTQEAQLARQLMKDVVGASGAMRDEAARLAILEDSVERLNTELDAYPDVQAALLLALGESHAARLRDDEAANYLERSAARFEQAGDHDGAARALEGLAAVLSQGGAPRAVSVAEEALALRRTQFPGGSVHVARAERLLARTLLARLPEREEDARRAAQLLDNALADLRTRLGEADPEVAATQVLRARMAPSASEAVALYAAALEVLERRPGEARRTIECLDGYAGALLSMDRLAQADDLLRRSAQLTRQTYGERHTVDHLRRRARIEQMCGNLPGAELLARSALAIELEGWVDLRPEDETDLAELARRVREDDTAPYAEALEVLRGLRGNGDFELSSWASSLAHLLNELERPEQAEAVLREGLNIYCRVYGLDCPNRMRNLYQLAQHLARAGRVEAARVWLDELLQRLEGAGQAGDQLRLEASELAESLTTTAREVAR